MEDGRPRLPPPLSEHLLQEVLQELPTGARLATETCYTCWQESKFPTPEFLSFLRSISTHSKILKRLFPADGGDAESESTLEKAETEGSTPRQASDGILDASLDEVSNLDPEMSDNETDRIQHQRRLAEVQRRRLQNFPGSVGAQTSRYLQWIMVELRGLLPTKGKSALLQAVRKYLSDSTQQGFQEFAKTIKELVDAHNVQLPLVYTPHRVHEPASSAAAEGKKRPQPDKETTRKKEATAVPPAKAKKKSFQQGDGNGGGSGEDDKDLSDEELMVLSKQLGRQLGGPSKFTSCEDLRDTYLGQFLANRARAVSSRNVVVKVVADVLKQPHLAGTRGGATGGGPPCRSKAMFAFLRVDNSPHYVLCFGMYVHEYGPGCAPTHAGRVYVECVDSVPLYGKEKGEERQALLSAIVLGYFDFVRDMGFRYAHMRVPPPTDENSHIFASRSLIVRLRASLHLAHWFKRLLATAQQNGTISSYEAAPTGSMPNFPLSLLHPGEMAAELAFRNVDYRTLDPQSQQLMQRVIQLKERFFVVALQRDEAPKPHVPDMTHLLESAIAADRCELVGVCISQRLRFATVQQAKYATMMLVHRMEAEQVQQSAAHGTDMQGLGNYSTHRGEGRPMMGGHPSMGMAEMGAHGEAVSGGMPGEMMGMGGRPELADMRAGARPSMMELREEIMRSQGPGPMPGMRPEDDSGYGRMDPATLAAMEMSAGRGPMRGMGPQMGGGEYGGWGYAGNGMEDDSHLPGPRGRGRGVPPASMPHERFGPGGMGRAGEQLPGRMEGGPGGYGGLRESEFRARAQAEVERRLMMHQQMAARGPGASPGASPGRGPWMRNEQLAMQGRGGPPRGHAWEDMPYGAGMGMGLAQSAMKADPHGGGQRMYGSPQDTLRVQREMAMMGFQPSSDKRPVRESARGFGPGSDGMDAPDGKELARSGHEMTRSAAQSFADSFMVDLDPSADGPMYGDHGGMGEMVPGQDDGAGSSWPEDGSDPALIGERTGDPDEVGNWGY